MTTPRFVHWFREIGIADVALVGGKNASLGEMCRELVPHGIRVPDGFATTAEAYRHFLRSGGLDGRIAAILRGLDTRDLGELAARGRRVREAVLAAPLPDDLRREIADAYAELCREYGPETDTAVRSSATAEDLPTASFAGQQESFLNVRGERALLDAVRQCLASLYTDRAISYRVDKGFDHAAVALSVGVQRMVRSDLGAAGVLFTLDTESGFPDVVLRQSGCVRPQQTPERAQGRAAAVDRVPRSGPGVRQVMVIDGGRGERGGAWHTSGHSECRRFTPLYPSHARRNAEKRVGTPARPPAACYTAASYGRAVERGIKRCNAARKGSGLPPVPHWRPNRLRHALATEVRRRHGLEAAQVVLGHARADVTQVYAERDLSFATRVALELG